MNIRDALASDAETVFVWANDPASRAASSRTDPIPWEDHESWFRERLADPATDLLIAEDDQPIGVVRFQRRGERAEISVNLSPNRRGQGLGTMLILAGCSEFSARHPEATVIAFIRPENDGSKRAFLNAGFRPDGSETVREVPMLRFVKDA